MSSDDTFDDGSGEADTPTRWPLILGIVVVIGGLFTALFLFGGDDDDTEPMSSVDATTAPPASSAPGDTDAPTTAPEVTEPPATEPPTTEPPTTEPSGTESPATEPPATEPPVTQQPPSALWPWAVTDTRFDDPVEAATSFASDFLGFTDAIVGEFQAGDSRSGEVEIRPRVDGELTVVFVRQEGDDDSWWVLGSVAEGISIDSPEQAEVVSSPLTITGSATAFEGTVDVELRADGDAEPIATSFVTGGAGPELEPFEGSIEFTSPGDVGGALVLRSISPEDGSVVEASALRIAYSD